MRRVLESSRWNIRVTESRVSCTSWPRAATDNLQTQSSVISHPRFASSYAEPPRTLSRDRSIGNRIDNTFRPSSRAPRPPPGVLINVSGQQTSGSRWNGRPSPNSDRSTQSNNRAPSKQGEPSRFFRRPQPRDDQNPRPAASTWRHQPQRPSLTSQPSTSANNQPTRQNQLNRQITPAPKIKTDFRREDTRRTRQIDGRSSKPEERMANKTGSSTASQGQKKPVKDKKSTQKQRVKRIQARRDLYIPSVISVANFAKLLGVRHGANRF